MRPPAGQWGVAVQSKFLAVGSVVPWAAPGVGAVATQAYANPRYGPAGLELLREGLTAEEVVAQLTADDEGREQRQLGVVDAHGRGASFTGSACMGGPAGARGRASPHRGTSSSRRRPWTRSRRRSRRPRSSPSPSGCSPASRRPRRPAATRAGSSPPRCSWSSATPATQALSDTLVDLRVDDHARPVEELQRLYRLHEALFGRTPRAEWLPLEGELAAEVQARLESLGYERLADWAGVENLEERVDGEEAIDPVVLEQLRDSTA